MSIEENKAIVRRWVEEPWNQGNLVVLDELAAPTYVRYPEGTLETHKTAVAAVRATFPDLHITIEMLIAEGDLVAYRWTAHGTHQGEFEGIPPTGKPVTVTGISINRIVDGKIVEDWFESGSPSIQQQLGVAPAPGQPTS